MPVAPEVTLNWSTSRLLKRSWGWVANETWVVTGYTSKAEAIEAACPFNLPHWDNPNMTAGVRDARQTGPISYLVTAEFSFGDHGQCQPSPLNEPTKIQWRPTREYVQSDADINGNPKVNSAGDPYSTPRQRPIPGADLICRRFEPYYSIAVALQYQDHVNSATFSVIGAGTVGVGNAYCEYYRPTQMYTNEAPYLEVEYCFRFRSGTDPWQDNPTDMGRNGWYDYYPDPSNVSKYVTLKGPFCTANGQPVSADILLDGTGQPINAGTVDTDGTITEQGYFVLGADGAIHTPQPNPNLPTGFSLNQDLTTANMKVDTWKDKSSVDFMQLNL